MPHLTITLPNGEVRDQPLDRSPVSLGRSEQNDICLRDEIGLSRHHLMFERDADGWTVRDCGSKNGTYLNGTRLRSSAVRLKGGDIVTAGGVALMFRAVARAEETVLFVDSGSSPARSETIVTRLANVVTATSIPAASAAAAVGAGHLSALIKAGRELAERRPLKELFEVILKLCVEAVSAENGLVLTAEGGEFAVRAVHGQNLRISSGIRDRVLNEGTSVLVRDLPSDEMYRGSQTLVIARVRTVMAVPLQTNERVIGLLYVDSSRPDRAFTPEDLNLLTVMANIAAIRIEHERLAEIEQTERILARDLAHAAEIQKALLPSAAPIVPGFDLAGINIPSRSVGGDYYDYLALPTGRIGIALGDVAGKAMPAALLMTSLQASVRVLAEHETVLSEMMERLNRVTAANCPPGKFITFCLCILDAANGRIEYCNAGHNPPLIVRRDGSVEQLTEGGPVLGILPQAAYSEATAQLDRGDLLILYSDGVTECPDAENQEFGEERLIDLLRRHAAEPAAVVVDRLCKAVTDWAPPVDDVTIVIARRD